MWTRLPPGTGLTNAITAVALLLTSSSTTALAAKEFEGQRWAVVIGVQEYENRDLRLPYADRDADEFYKFLLSPSGGAFPQDHIRKLTNKQVTLNSLRSALGTFLQDAKPDDYVVIYLSGHGLPDPRNASNFYFLPSRANLNDLAGSAVEMSEILKWVSGVLARRKLLITDACHSGALGTAGAAKGPNQVNTFLRGLAQSYQGLVVLTSSEGSQLSQVYKEKEHSYFTYFLLRALQEDALEVDGFITQKKDGVVDPREAYEWVRKQVMQATGNAQIPDKGGDLGIRIPLAIVPSGIVQAPPPVKRLDPIQEAHVRPYQTPGKPEARKELPQEITGKDGAPMVLIPAGSFIMGSPQQEVALEAFYIDKYEVTVERYAKFLSQTNNKAREPASWDRVDLAVHGKHPVTGVNYFDAEEYCRWAHKRLPSDEEWEKAARGTDGRLYPWGNQEPQEGMTNFNKNYCFFCNVYDDRLSPVGQFQRDKSPFNIFDMAGNVSEWVEEKHLRGGDWRTGWPRAAVFMELSRFSSDDPLDKDPGGNPTQGFRCAQGAPDLFPRVTLALNSFKQNYNHEFMRLLTDGQKQTLAWILEQPNAQQRAEAYIAMTINGVGPVRGGSRFDQILDNAVEILSRSPGNPIQALKPFSDKLAELTGRRDRGEIDADSVVQELNKFTRDHYLQKG